jgi:hypothetical protein
MAHLAVLAVVLLAWKVTELLLPLQQQAQPGKVAQVERALKTMVLETQAAAAAVQVVWVEMALRL